MIRRLISPSFLLPLSLVSPYLFLGPVGITAAEILVAFVFVSLTTPALIEESFKIPRFLFVYLLLLSIGWLGAIVNGVNWNITIGLGNISFFYKVMLAIASFYLGFRSRKSIEQVVTSPFFKAVVLGLGIVASVYPFLSYEQRFALLRFFFDTADGDIGRLHSTRFPGLGINANVYSFMVFMLLPFAFDAYVRGRISSIYPLMAFIAIVVAGSKLVISISAAACLVIVFSELVPVSIHKPGAIKAILVSKRALAVTLIVGFFGAGVYLFLTQSDLGKQIVDGLETFRRFSDAIEGAEGASSFGDRYLLWTLGMQRVMLAPILGIVPDFALADDTVTLRFSQPHNEFIEQWMFFGAIGVSATVCLLAFLLLINLRRKGSLVWFILYLGLIVHMFFDSAFTYVRFWPMFFIMVGMNVYQVRSLSSRDNPAHASPLIDRATT